MDVLSIAPTARLGRLALALGLVPLALASCGEDSGGGGGGASTEPAAQPTTLSITTSDLPGGRFSTQAPESIRGGLVKIVFKNAGRMPHEAQLIRVDGNRSVQEAVKIITSEDQRTPSWIHGAGGVGTTGPGQQATAISNLPAGRYAVIDTGGGPGEGPPPVTRGALAEFQVSGGQPGELPATQARIVAKDAGEENHAFLVTGLKAGRNTVLFDNRSDQIHHAILAPILPGKTFAEVKKALSSEEPPSGPPPVDFEKTISTVVLDGQTQQVVDMQLQPGRYVVTCFVADREGGPPHIAEGMIDEVMVR